MQRMVKAANPSEEIHKTELGLSLSHLGQNTIPNGRNSDKFCALNLQADRDRALRPLANSDTWCVHTLKGGQSWMFMIKRNLLEHRIYIIAMYPLTR